MHLSRVTPEFSTKIRKDKHIQRNQNLFQLHIFQVHLIKPSNFWNTTQKECYAVYKSVQKFAFYLTGTDFTLYCDHKPLTPFFTTEMSSHVLDWWTLELQQFNLMFEYILGKKNMVADVISRLRTFGLYQDNNNEDVQLSLKDAIKYIREEIHSFESTPKIPGYTKIDKLNVDLLRKEQLHARFCKKKVKEIKQNPTPASS